MADLDSVTSLGYYPQGVMIGGEKDSQTVTRYFNTLTMTFEIPTDAAPELHSIEMVPNSN